MDPDRGSGGIPAGALQAPPKLAKTSRKVRGNTTRRKRGERSIHEDSTHPPSQARHRGFDRLFRSHPGARGLREQRTRHLGHAQCRLARRRTRCGCALPRRHRRRHQALRRRGRFLALHRRQGTVPSRLHLNSRRTGPGTNRCRGPAGSIPATVEGSNDPDGWCRREESNLRPTDYESVALPTELHRLKRGCGPAEAAPEYKRCPRPREGFRPAARDPKAVRRRPGASRARRPRRHRSLFPPAAPAIP